MLQKDFRISKILETDEQTEKEICKPFQNVNRSNHKNINAFLKILVDQKTAYLVSKEPTIKVSGAEESTQKRLMKKCCVNLQMIILMKFCRIW